MPSSSSFSSRRVLLFGAAGVALGAFGMTQAAEQLVEMQWKNKDEASNWTPWDVELNNHVGERKSTNHVVSLGLISGKYPIIAGYLTHYYGTKHSTFTDPDVEVPQCSAECIICHTGLHVSLHLVEYEKYLKRLSALNRKGKDVTVLTKCRNALLMYRQNGVPPKLKLTPQEQANLDEFLKVHWKELEALKDDETSRDRNDYLGSVRFFVNKFEIIPDENVRDFENLCEGLCKMLDQAKATTLIKKDGAFVSEPPCAHWEYVPGLERLARWYKGRKINDVLPFSAGLSALESEDFVFGADDSDDENLERLRWMLESKGITTMRRSTLKAKDGLGRHHSAARQTCKLEDEHGEQGFGESVA